MGDRTGGLRHDQQPVVLVENRHRDLLGRRGSLLLHGDRTLDHIALLEAVAGTHDGACNG
jgi:hypothetical protein